MKLSFSRIAFLLSVAISGPASLIIYTSEPWNITTESRIDALAHVAVIWARACEKDFLVESGSGQRIDLSTNTGLPLPGDEGTAVPGNRFTIAGFRYRNTHTNILTGRSRESANPRVDVQSWTLHAPYEAYGSDGQIRVFNSARHFGSTGAQGASPRPVRFVRSARCIP